MLPALSRLADYMQLGEHDTASAAPPERTSDFGPQELSSELISPWTSTLESIHFV